MNIIIIVGISYVVILLVIKKLRLLEIKKIKGKPICPSCKNNTKRISRENKDKILKYLTLFLFDFKRYSCFHCSWEGVRN